MIREAKKKKKKLKLAKKKKQVAKRKATTKVKPKVVKQMIKQVTEPPEICRKVKWHIPLAMVSILLHVKYPLMLRVSLTQDGTRNLAFNSNSFYKYPDGSDPFVECSNLKKKLYILF